MSPLQGFDSFSNRDPRVSRCALTLGYFVSRRWREDTRYRTGSGPGSPRGQPAWGGGCDRIINST